MPEMQRTLALGLNEGLQPELQRFDKRAASVFGRRLNEGLQPELQRWGMSFTFPARMNGPQ